MTVEDQILKEVREIKKDGKATHIAVQNSALAIARIEGDIKLHTSQIERNTSDIAKNEVKIGKVDGRVNGLIVKVTGAASAAGAAAGAVANAIVNTVKGGG
jgi:hypothetical protein